WRLFHSRRWLPSDEVRGLALAADGNLLVETAGGIVKFSQQTTTLDEKMAAINRELQAQHLREGLVGAIHGPTPGKVTPEWTQGSDDNDGLWTSLYVAAEAFRYGATGAADAKANAWKSLRALMFLEEVTGIPGFAARSIWPNGPGVDAQKMFGGEWHQSADGKWWWKGDTSSDELDGHYFAYPIYYDLCATPEEKKEIQAVVARITDHLIDHGYYYVGPSGKPTRWGVFAPERLNHDIEWIVERGINSLEILSHLKVADHICGGTKYADAARKLIDEHAYAMNTVYQKLVWPLSEVNHSDDELAFLAYYPLLWYERDPQLRHIYLESIHRSWEFERPEGSPFLNFIYAAARQATRWPHPTERPPEAFLAPEKYDRDRCLEWFRLVPQETLDWRVVNSGRQDVGEILKNRFDQARSSSVLPVDERRQMRWNGDPFELDGGAEGRRRDDGAYILLPYWMGRWHRFLD
ncbi:MAG: hypothetical protein JNG90_17305, partial [Planctomycetaceae bacterium]|nr:hypothetical protein [Planctomycetaceae bacterium]